MPSTYILPNKFSNVCMNKSMSIKNRQNVVNMKGILQVILHLLFLQRGPGKPCIVLIRKCIILGALIRIFPFYAK